MFQDYKSYNILVKILGNFEIVPQNAWLLLVSRQASKV